MRNVSHSLAKSTLLIFTIMIFAACAARAADPRVCILKYEEGTTPSYKYGTPCTTAAAAYGGTKNLIKFDQGCGGSSYKVAVVYEQGSNNTGLGSYELFMGFKASDFGAPVYSSTPSDCSFNPNSLNYFPTIMSGGADCPGGSGDNSYVHGAAGADLSNPYAWPSPAPNVDLFTVKFNSMNYTTTNMATATIAFTNRPQSSLYDPSSTEITTFTYQDADAYCDAPCSHVRTPTAPTVTPGTPSCAGSPPTGTVSGIKIGYTLPTQCQQNGADVACGTSCSSIGVTVKKILPAPEETIAEKVTTTSVTDSTARAAGTQLTYSITGVCVSGAACDSPTSLTVNYTPECGNPPSISTCKAGGKDCSAYDTSGLEGAPIKITGQLTDSDSTASQLQVGLYYGTEDDNPPFPTHVAGTVASDKSFNVEIPGTAVRCDNDIYYALWATDQTMLTTKAPATYDGTPISAYLIDNSNVILGGWGGSSCGAPDTFGFAPGNEPYPNQFPFQPGIGNLRIGFQITKESVVTMRIYSTDGRLVRQLENNSDYFYMNTNTCNFLYGCEWDGTDLNGADNVVPNGLYVINISATSLGSPPQTLSYTKGIVVMK